MKRSLAFLIFLFLTNYGFSQKESSLKYKDGNFYKMGSFSESWKSSDHIFESDPLLTKQYIRFKRAKKGEEFFKYLAVAKLVTGFALFRSAECHTPCYPYLIGISMILTAPISGLVSLIFNLFSNNRKETLLKAYNKRSISEFSNYSNRVKLTAGFTNNGFGVFISF